MRELPATLKDQQEPQFLKGRGCGDLSFGALQ